MITLVEGVDVSRETEQRLRALEALLSKWNPAINLVSKSTISSAWDRHILDSVQIFAGSGPFRTWVDLGSGGGFPGLVVGVLAAEKRPDARIILVESDQRKATFLRQAARELGLTRVQVIAERIEVIAPIGADRLSARALAPLTDLCGYAAHHLLPEGTALFPKGATWRAEVAEARKSWKFDLEVRPSLVESGSVVLVMKAISHV